MREPIVLIVDDSRAERAFAAAVVRESGCHAVFATSGSEALAQLASVTPDVIITDLHMPGMDGNVLIRAVRSRPGLEDKPILVCTSDTTRAAKIELLRHGADDFLTKPLDADELRARLAALLRQNERNAELVNVRDERDRLIDDLKRQSKELEQLTHGLVVALERANAYNDTDTGNHIRRVASYSAALAEARGCDPSFVRAVHRYAGLHDVGKVGIPDSILKKPGQLTQQEFEVMKRHSEIGYQLLHSAGLPTTARNIPRHHHERWDGTGYPHGLAGEDIPLEARIVAVADVYDALTTRRSYKPAFPTSRAREMMKELAGHHLDPLLVQMFLASSERIAGQHC